MLLGNTTARRQLSWVEGGAGRSRTFWGAVRGLAPGPLLCICGSSYNEPGFSKTNRGTLPCGHQAENQPWVSAHSHPRMQLPQEGCLQDASSAGTLTASLWAVSAQDEPPKGLGVSVSTGGRNADSPEDPNLLRGFRGGRVERGARPSVP